MEHTGKHKLEVLVPFGGQPHVYGRDDEWNPDFRDRSTPETEIQALMEAAPHEEPERSKAELAPLRELLADAIDKLDERERYIVEAVVIEKKTYRALARELSMSISSVHQILHGRDDGFVPQEGALAKLAQHLETLPEIRRYLNVDTGSVGRARTTGAARGCEDICEGR